MWRLYAVLLLGALSVGLVGQAAAAPRSAKARIETKGQRTLAQRGTVRVAAAVRRPGTYTVRLRLRTSRTRAVTAGHRRARLTGRGQRILAVRLNARGRALVRRCVYLRALVTVTRGKRAVARTSRLLRTGTARCRRAAGDGKGPGAGPPGAPGTPSAPGPSVPGPSAPGPTAPVAPGFDTSRADVCDPLDPAVCLQPFSNDHFTTADTTAATGRRLALTSGAMPANVLGKPIDPAELNVADGFSPGSSLITRVPGLDGPEAAVRTGLPAIDDPTASLAADSPVVVINTRTGERHPVWAEVDANPATPSDRNLIVRPAVNFREGEHYAVALRRMRRADGSLIPAGRAFQVYRDGIVTTAKVVEARRPAMERTLAALSAAGIDRGSLFLAWDFTVATPKTIASRMLSIRDRAFADLGDTTLADRIVQGRAPGFRLNPDLPDNLPELPGAPVSFADVDGVRNFTPEQDPRIARVVRGTFDVPCYLSTPGCVNGGSFVYAGGDRFTPTRIPGNVAIAQFTCEIPRRALAPDATEKLRPNLYGHGLFGSQSEVGQGQEKALAQDHGFLPCATDWSGMATQDVPTALAVLQDLSQFPLLIDHVQQGFLQQLFLGRLMLHPDGLSSNAAFQRPGGDSVIDTRRLFYDGNSQGGIYGGTLTAIAPDYERAALGVPGMNYSTLLPRSADFDTYANGSFGGFDSPVGGLYDSYPDELQRPLILALLQVMWDRGDPNGYAQHMTGDPLPNTPSHEVLMHVALGDHQVADVSAEVMARTVGARMHRPGLEPLRRRFSFGPAFGRTSVAASPTPFQLLSSLGPPGYSATGSGVVFWDIGPLRTEGADSRGTPSAPAQNVPPRVGQDPHEAPRNSPAAREQKSEFLRDDGRIVDVCGGPCYAFDYAGGAAQP